MKPPPGPDRSQIETFVLALFKHATADHWVSLRAFFEDSTNLPPFNITPIKLNGNFNVLIDQAYHVAELAAHNHKKVVFCPPIATFTNNRRAREADLAEGLALSVECDAHAEAARVKLEELLGLPTVVVASGGEWTNPKTGEPEPKLHAHYRLKAPAGSKGEQEKLKQARKLAAKIVGGDPSNVPLVHPIRWPGSLHRKGDPKLCHIVSLNPDAEINLDTALGILQKAAGNDSGGDRDESGSGHGFRFMLDCHTEGMSYQEARAAILADKNEAGEWANRVDERQLERAWERSKPIPDPKPGKKLPLIVELGLMLWGAATANGKEYRFGADQSKVIDPIKGNWFDFTTNKGGGIRDLMKKVGTANRTNDAVVVCAASIKMRALDWLWPEHLLRGAQELLSGLPDLGKSQVQISYVACATAGLPWPNGAPPIEPVNAIMLTAEDTLDQLVVPRLRAAGADLNRVRFLKCIKTDEHDRQFLLAEDLHQLERVISDFGNVGLVTIDPITAYMGSKMDSHKTTEVRAQLGPLKDLAERLNIVVSTLTHPPKSAGQRALDHFIGSQAFIAACRVGHLCIAEMEEKADGERVPTGRILFTTVRNSAGPLKQTLAFYKKQVDEVGREERGLESRVITASRVIWDGVVDITADAAVAATSSKKQPDLQPKVQAFLREMLKDGKPVPQKEIEEAGAKNGFTEKQLRTAREKLGIHADKEAGKMTGGWFWQLPNPNDGKYYY
jgi:hypothetical protein